MKTNLLSLGQLLEKGFVMRMNDNCLKVFDKVQKLVIKADLSQNKTFRIGMNILKHKCLATSENKMEWLWHHRFGHLNFKDLHLLTWHKMVEGLLQVLVPQRCAKSVLNASKPKASSTSIFSQIIINYHELHLIVNMIPAISLSFSLYFLNL